jgi:hypothetical protein
VPVTEYNPGQGLDFKIAQGGELFLREISHLRLREFDVVEIALAHLAHGALDVAVAEPELFRRPFVELLGEPAHRGVAFALHLGENSFHRLAHLRIGRLDCACIHSALEMPRHYFPPVSSSDAHLIPSS